MKNNNENINAMEWGYFVVGLVFGLGIGIVFVLFVVEFTSISLSQETGNDVCGILTGDNSSIASVTDWKLICTTPEHESNQNIIIKSGDGE